jgi:hypothetical protein
LLGFWLLKRHSSGAKSCAAKGPKNKANSLRGDADVSVVAVAVVVGDAQSVQEVVEMLQEELRLIRKREVSRLGNHDARGARLRLALGSILREVA